MHLKELVDDSWGKSVIFRDGNNLSVHVNNIVFGDGPTQGLDDTTITAEARYHIKFVRSERRSVLSLHYNGSNSFFVLIS